MILKSTPITNMVAAILSYCDSAGARTQDPDIKSVVLYQLSYEVIIKSICQRSQKLSTM